MSALFSGTGLPTSPTANAERHMIYAAIQAGANGLSFWENDDGGVAWSQARSWAQAILIS